MKEAGMSLYDHADEALTELPRFYNVSSKMEPVRVRIMKALVGYQVAAEGLVRGINTKDTAAIGAAQSRMKKATNNVTAATDIIEALSAGRPVPTPVPSLSDSELAFITWTGNVRDNLFNDWDAFNKAIERKEGKEFYVAKALKLYNDADNALQEVKRYSTGARLLGFRSEFEAALSDLKSAGYYLAQAFTNLNKYDLDQAQAFEKSGFAHLKQADEALDTILE